MTGSSRVSTPSTACSSGFPGSTDATSTLDKGRVIARMVGRELTELFPRVDRTPADVVFEARGVTVEDPNVEGKYLVRNVGFSVRRGEVVEEELGACQEIIGDLEQLQQVCGRDLFHALFGAWDLADSGRGVDSGQERMDAA